jgi:predicted transposase/invertase (TIGR01784 family)
MTLFIDMANAFVFPDNERAFRSARLIDREQSPLRISGKGGRLNVFAIMDGFDQINLEVQVGYESDFRKRVLTYWSLVHGGQLNKGDKYSDIARTISVNLLGYDEFTNKSDADFRSSFSIRDDDTGEKFSDGLQLIFLEVGKYERINQAPVSKMDGWMAYFAGKGDREMAQIAEREPMIAEALDREKLFMADRDQRLAYILDWKQMMDEANREARYREREEKIREGEEKTREAERKLAASKYEIARNILADGISPDIAAKYTGLSLEEVKNLAQQ